MTDNSLHPPKVSVVIPAYRVEATLARAIDSALRQDVAGLEVVVVDDGSPDRSGAIADDYAARYDNVRVVHQANAGLAEARRVGAHTARGEWIVPLDSDDTLPDGAVAALLKRGEELDLDLVYGAWNRVVGDRRWVQYHFRTGTFSGDEFLTYLFDRRCFCGSGTSASKRALWLNDVFPPKGSRLPSEDILINIRLSEHIRRMGVFNDMVVYDYYYNEDSLSVSGTLHQQSRWRWHFDYVRAELARMGKLDALEPAVRQMELERFAFQMKEIDTTDEWYRRVLSYPTAGMTRRSRVIQTLLRSPALLHAAVRANRSVKSVLSRLKS